MIYIYCPRSSTGARDLAQAINGIRPGAARRVRGLERVRSGDVVVSWGAGALPALPAGVRTLNSVRGISKLTELRQLKEAGVAVPEFQVERPPMPDGWLARSADHVGGDDLLTPPRTPAFWTRWENLTHEFRIHVFKHGEEYSSVRAGMKKPRVANPHPWIRSWDAGWHLMYDADCQLALNTVCKGVRAAAKSAVQALGLDFGAVDVGWVARTRRAMVLEVNRAPGNEGQTSVRYAENILRRVGG